MNEQENQGPNPFAFPGDKMVLPADQIPSFNVGKAIKKGNGKKFLIVTWGGLGDQVCAEPVIRYAQKVFKGIEISLASEAPELFSHLEFKEVFDLKRVKPVESNYMVFRSIVDPSNLLWEFFSHCLAHCVDFCSVCMFRLQLPVADKEIKLEADEPDTHWAKALLYNKKKYVVVHAGKHWPSKTFPKEWWDDVLSEIIKYGLTPILIGKDTDDNRSTVDVNSEGCVDLRNKTSIKELIWLCKNTNVLLTNDSSPLHIAAAGEAHIGFIASCKHPDYITHWRNGQWGWRMKNLGKDGMWNHTDFNPIQEKEVTVEFIEPELMQALLPTPVEVMDYVRSTL